MINVAALSQVVAAIVQQRTRTACFQFAERAVAAPVDLNVTSFRCFHRPCQIYRGVTAASGTQLATDETRQAPDVLIVIASAENVQSSTRGG